MAKMRHQQHWGEDNLGDVDPSSATMNLMLLGLRGIATDVLWVQAKNQKERKQWGKLKHTVDSIVQLQPHYEAIWKFQGWNLAYNVSAEWDGVKDRYYWVKEGGKFMIKGSKQNVNSPLLKSSIGKEIYTQKIGTSDEWLQFRQFFRVDPDEKTFPNGTDGEFDPHALKDNYLVAKEWFHEANKTQKKYDKAKRGTAFYFFRQDRAKAQINYAKALNKEGMFNEKSRNAWEEAWRNWTTIYEDDSPGYGKEEFPIGDGTSVYMEARENDFKQMAKKNGVSVERIKSSVVFLQNTTKYRYWRALTEIEKEKNTLEAHQEIYEGEQLYFKGKPEKAAKRLYSGMQKFEKMLFESYRKENGNGTQPKSLNDFFIDELVVEEALKAQVVWRKALDFSGGSVPKNYPLKALWENEKYKKLISGFERRLEREAELLLEKD
ncbi:similar to IRE (iron responsive element) [hydrothermal vent metagenome]|uniref:Similar to IRE (Iron responsive element) n=1 Tax=hydrothermal vent metagenome TaxID=652676 RepID=A0A3B1DEE2_9ZZZZ